MNKIPIKIIKSIAFIIIVSAVSNAQIQESETINKSGVHNVGFKVINTYDYSRSFISTLDFEGKESIGETARPITIYMWYPATSSSSDNDQMAFSEYVYLEKLSLDESKSASEIRIENKEAFTSSLQRAADEQEITDRFIESLLNDKNGVYKDAQPLEGNFPLILYTSVKPASFSSLGEHLASHGYIVAAIQKMGAMTERFIDRTPNPISIETRVRDLEFLVSYFRDFPNVDITRLGIMAYSSATLANVLFQMRNMRSGVMIGLESWEGFKSGIEILKESPYYKPEKIRTPYLRIGKSKEESSPVHATTFEFFNSIKYSDRYDIRFEDADHFSFSPFKISTKTY